jgi:hypothetical protein
MEKKKEEMPFKKGDRVVAKTTPVRSFTKVNGVPGVHLRDVVVTDSIPRTVLSCWEGDGFGGIPVLLLGDTLDVVYAAKDFVLQDSLKGPLTIRQAEALMHHRFLRVEPF